jgi:hypothetical protein
MGGHSTSFMHYAIPDYGVFTSTEMIEIAGRVAEAIDIPLVVDADEAGESVASVHRAIRRYERHGIAGVHIEDEYDPKHSVWDGPLLPLPELKARVETAVNARNSDDFVIIVRSNEFQLSGDQPADRRMVPGGGTGSLDQMIRRALTAKEAGADGFIPTWADKEQIAAIAAEVDLPLGDFQGLTPGLRFTLFTGWGVTGAIREHFRIATHIFEHGTLPEDWAASPLIDRRSLMDQSMYDDVVRRWADTTGRPTRHLSP